MNTAAIRVVLIATLLYGLNAWSRRHLGSGLQEFAIVNGFLGFLGVALSLIDGGEAQNLRDNVKGVFRRIADTRILLPLCLLAIVGTSLVSSVTVISDGVAGTTTLHLTPEGEARCETCQGKRLMGPNDSIRFIHTTSVFGRPFYLEASGYQRKSLVLLPWTGSTISLASDLVQLPSVILRIPPSLHTLLAGGKVVIEVDGQASAIEIPTQAGRASVRIGPAVAVPEGWRNEWRSQLRTFASVPESLRESFFRNWLNPIGDESATMIAPGQHLLIRFITAADKEVIRQDFIVGREPLQDVVLTPKSQP